MLRVQFCKYQVLDRKKFHAPIGTKITSQQKFKASGRSTPNLENLRLVREVDHILNLWKLLRGRVLYTSGVEPMG